MAKQLNVNLSFTADTSKARAQLQDLQNQLTKLINTPVSNFNLEQDISGAIRAAAELKSHLTAATNIKTGNLDFTKLNQSITRSGKSLTQYADQLRSLGPTGQSAFISLANAVATSEIPIRRSNALLKEMGVTLANTARWQISSSILHGFMGAVKSAYGYAKDLNESLNNIRIVTGQNIDQMSEFAEKANKAAKALSTTTTNYTNASLIYYQQGLSDKEVQERTDITIKMANVSRSSAEEVSDQLTAVWNNFYDGSKSLEYYADVMTALGAATASSTDEISEGLNKFAAVAETVGLSYEYAAAALATVTATTRQSADIVGNAFKTLFARLQGLNLGETLDDGTTLNKYSQALMDVGIDIKDVNGDIKDMDTILNELGEKWETLGKDQQIALAQTVAGVRQYTQLIALMDNWDYFQENLGVVNTSSGALQEQADIYAQSWEAASKRVKAAAQGIYQDLIDDKFFIGLLNKIEKILGFIDNLIDGFGGLKGVLMVISTLMMKTFSQQMARGITNMSYNLQMSTKKGREKIQAKRTETLNNMIGKIPASTEYTGTAEEARVTTMRKTLELQVALTENADKMSDFELETNRVLMDRNKILAENYQKEAQNKEAKENRRGELVDNMRIKVAEGVVRTNDARSKENRKEGKALRQEVAGKQKLYGNRISDISSFAEMNKVMAGVNKTTGITKKQIEELKKAAQNLKSDDLKSLKDWITTSEHFGNNLDEIEEALLIVRARIKESMTAPAEQAGGFGLLESEVEELIQTETELLAVNDRVSASQKEFTNDTEKLRRQIETSKGTQATWADGLVSYASAVGAVTSAIQSVIGLIDVWNDKDMSFGEKLLTTFSTLAMILPMVITSFSRLNLQQMASASASLASALGFKATAAAATKAAAGTASFATTLWTVLWPILAVTAALGAIIGIVYLFTRGKEKEASAVEKASKAIADQEKTVAKLNERLDEARTELQDIMDLLSEYKNLDDAFDKLVEGSAEWIENLQKQNQLVHTLIEKYPELIEMGGIGFKDGLYQILNFDMVDQYTRRKATSEQLSAELGVTGANYVLELKKAEYNRLKAESDLLNEKGNSIDYRASNVSAVSSGSQFTVSAQLNGATFTGNYNDENNRYIPYLTGDDNHKQRVLSLLESDMEDAALAVQHEMLVNGVTNAKEAAKNILKTDDYFRLADDVTQQLVYDVADYLYSQGNYFNQLEEIQSKEIMARSRLLQEFEAKWQMQAQSILSAQSGYRSLDALERQAATVLTADALQVQAKKYDYGVIAKNNDLSVDFITALATGLGREEDATEWAELFGTTKKKKDKYNDAYDFFKYTQFGQDLLNDYLANEKGTVGGLTNFSDVKRDSYKITFGDGQEVTYAEVLDYYASNLELTGVDYKGIMNMVQGADKAVLAALVGDINSLTEQELLNSGLAKKDETGAYSIDTESAAYINARRLAGFESYNADTTDLTKEEWQAQKKVWEETVAQGVKNYDAALAETIQLQQDLAKGQALIAQAAEKYKLDPKVLENYTKSIYNMNKAQGVSYEEASKMAIANARYSRGMKNLQSDIKNYTKLLSSANKENYQTIEAATELGSIMEDILGIEVSTDFVIDHFDKIQQLAEGNFEVLEELELLAAKDYVAHLMISDEYKETLNNILADLESKGPLELGAEVTISPQYIETLNTMLKNGQITAEELNSIFGSIGWSPNVETKEVQIGTTTTKYNGKMVGADGKETLISGEFTTENWATMPQIVPDGETGTTFSNIGPKTYTPTDTSSSGGGGKQEKEKKSSSDEKDRYHVVREQLEDLNKVQEKVAKSKEQAFGKAKVDLMQAEVEVLDDLIAKQDEYLTEIDDYLRKDRAKMIVYGAEFDENGVISNYDALLQKELDIYNAAVEKFNKDGNEEAFEAAEERYENFKKDLEQYEETMDLWEDEQAERAEMLREKWDQQFEALTYEIEFKLDIEEDSLKLLDYFLSKIEDDAFAAAEAIGLLGQQTQDAIDKIELNRQGIEGLLGMHNLDMSILDQIQKGEVPLEDLGEYGFSDEEISQLRTYVEGLTDGNTELLELRETIQDKVLEALDAWNEKIDTNIDKMDSLTSIMESYQSIIELVGKSTLKLNDDFLNNLAQEGVNNSVNKLATSVAKYNGLLEEQSRAQEALDKARESGSEQDIKLWEKTLQEVGAMVDEAQQGMMDSWNEALESAADAFEQAVANAVDTFEKSMAGAFGNLDGLQEVFDQQAEIAERYLADYAKIYELNKLNRDITNSIDDNDSIKAKRVLRDLQKEINDLQESETELSQYDVDHLRKKYELRLAEIALEEAQNAKSQVRMRRDTEGNWSYVYTADENKVEEARQNYEDKLYEMQELNNEYIHEMQSNILKSEVELANALRELDKVKFASDEEYYAEVARLQGYYLGQHNYYTDELNKALGNNQETYDIDWTNYSNLTGYKISKNEEYADKFNETILSQLTGYQTLEEVQDAFTNHSQAMVEDLKVAYDNWKANYDTIFNTAGTSIDNFANTTASAYEKIATDSQKATEDAQQTAKDMTTAFDDICTAVTTWQETWSTALSEAIKENEKFITSTYNLIKALSELKGTIPETDKPSESTQEDINNAKDELNNSNNNITNADGNGDKDKKSTYRGYDNEGIKDRDLIKAAQRAVGLEEADVDGYWGKKSQDKAAESEYQTTSVTEVLKAMNLLDKDRQPKTVPALESNRALIKLDTGGYTGTWNNTNGRLAMLHQKELVLNEMDTANMLKAVEIVRSIARVIDLNAGSQANGLGYLNATSANNHNQVIEQEVTIHAEFPNATDHNEIEMAFDTLINRASQFANRKNI